MVSKQISMEIVAAVLIGAAAVDGQSCIGKPNSEGVTTLPGRFLIIPKNAFVGCEPQVTLLKITAGAQVTEFGTNAFKSLTKLKKVEFVSSKTLKIIGISAFESAIGLSSFRFPQAVTEIKQHAFKGATALASVTFRTGYIRSRIEKIGRGAFEGTSKLTTIIIPAGVNIIEPRTFNSSGLETITFPKTSKIKKIGESAFRNATKLSTIAIPDRVTAIGPNAFEGTTALTTIVIPDGVKKLEPNTFVTSGLESITFGSKSKLEAISSSAFVTKVGTSKLATIVIPNGVRIIMADTFKSSVLRSIEFGPNSKLKTIGANAFKGSKRLTRITIPANVESIQDSAFENTGISTLTFESDSLLKEIRARAFFGTKRLKKLRIPKSVDKLEKGAFQNAGLESVIFKEGSKIKNIGSKAFANNPKLDTINIPKNVRIASDAFDKTGCEDSSIFAAGVTVENCVVVDEGSCTGKNLALGRPVETSCSRSKSKFAVDGKFKTQWRCDGRPNPYIVVDLGTVQKVKKVKLVWGKYFAKQFMIRWYDQATLTWKEIIKDTKGQVGAQTFTTNVSTRFIIVGAKSLNSGSISLRGFEVRSC